VRRFISEANIPIGYTKVICVTHHLGLDRYIRKYHAHLRITTFFSVIVMYYQSNRWKS